MLFPLGFFAMWPVVFPLVGATFSLPSVGPVGAGLEPVPPGPPFLCIPLVDPLSFVCVSGSVGVLSPCGVSCLWCCPASSTVTGLLPLLTSSLLSSAVRAGACLKKSALYSVLILSRSVWSARGESLSNRSRRCLLSWTMACTLSSCPPVLSISLRSLIIGLPESMAACTTPLKSGSFLASSVSHIQLIHTTHAPQLTTSDCTFRSRSMWSWSGNTRRVASISVSLNAQPSGSKAPRYTSPRFPCRQAHELGEGPGLVLYRKVHI
eukprot:8320702-Pyramimonas_sp.AAC.1